MTQHADKSVIEERMSVTATQKSVGSYPEFRIFPQPLGLENQAYCAASQSRLSC